MGEPLPDLERQARIDRAVAELQAARRKGEELDLAHLIHRGDALGGMDGGQACGISRCQQRHGGLLGLEMDAAPRGRR